jgi:heat shock protein HslJ/membrane-bound inhibitor of C-type lysozyme
MRPDPCRRPTLPVHRIGKILLRRRGLAATALLGLAVGLAGCAQVAPAVAPVAATPLRFASDLRCGDRTLRFGIGRHDGGDVPQLAVGERRIDLKEVVSASGARYEAIHAPGTTVWNKGTRATVVLDGEALPECNVVNLAPPAAHAPAPAGSPAATYAPLTARGNEPAWTLVLDQRLRFATDGRVIEGRTPAGQMRDGARIHDGALTGHHVTVEVRERVCGDSMSGMPHPYTVHVRVDDRTFRGCGGRPVDLLLGAAWVIEDIGGAGIVDRSRATLRFGDDGKVGGRASCNIFTGSYALTGESLTFGKVASSMMACAPALMEQERRFLDLLQAVHRFEIGDSGALVLITPDNRRITASRAG